jgi:hypothetical protein
MIRFANPGSDINSFTRIFQVLYEELGGGAAFGLDDVSAALVHRGLATSCGYTGSEALRRSSRTDRSRDPLYNQSKMYSELFRLLGWIHPTEDGRLLFQATWLGAHVAAAGPHAKPLVRECVLGIAFPNSVVAAKGEYRLRPFSLVLRCMAALDGLMCRDEMIVGPLSLADDTDDSAVEEMIARLRTLRGKTPSRLEAAVARLAKARKAQINTLENYTRFPLAVLEWSGWTRKERNADCYGRSTVFHRLSVSGERQVAAVQAAVDLRGTDVAGLSDGVQQAAARLGVVGMLERAGFATAHLDCDRDGWVRTLQEAGVLKTGKEPLLFSPFQELAPVDARRFIEGSTAHATGSRPVARALPTGTSAGRSRAASTVVRLRSGRGGIKAFSADSEAGSRLRAAVKSGLSDSDAAAAIVEHYENANKTDFYPAVASLLRCVGYECEHSRIGVNYQRSDAFISHPTDSMPIEIKSPGEERVISVKGVRQALENKIILLARKAAPTRRDTTSLVVGYAPPNDRAEVADLVADIHATYGLNIGVVDLRSLALLAAAAIRGEEHDHASFKVLKGFIDVVPASNSSS